MIDRSFARSFGGLTGAHSSDGNTASILVNGDRIFPEMLDAIHGARHSVNLLTYVYWSGSIAERFAEAVCERAANGVACRVLLDAYGAKEIDEALVERMTACGAAVCWFRPLAPVAINKINGRNHRKILVVDGRVGFTGGVGIAEEWTGDAQDEEHWRDTHVRMTGPAVAGLQGAFAESWAEGCGELLAGDAHFPALEAETDGSLIHVIRSDGRVGPSNATAAFQMLLAGATRTVRITSAYFAPDAATRAALIGAATRGVRVQVIVPGVHSDKPVVRSAGRGTYRELIEQGIEIYEFLPTMIHAKTIVVDDAMGFVGSINLDSRSMSINVEVAVAIFSESIARELGRLFDRDLAASTRIAPTDTSPRTPRTMARRAVGWTFRRQL